MLRLLALAATCAALKVPVSVKDVANGIRDGLQSGLKSRNSRLSVELPPGAPLALQGDEPDDFSWFGKQETETAKVIKGDRALADFAALLFPSDFAVAAVYAAPEAAKAAAASKKSAARCTVAALPVDGAPPLAPGKKKRKKKSRAAPAKGFGAAPAPVEAPPPWCPALGLRDRCDVVLIVGRLDEAAAAAVDAVADDLGDDVAMVLLNSRLDGLAARPGAVAGVCGAFSPAFALSPPPEPAGGGGGDLVASYEHPGPWAIGKPKLLGGCDVLWRGDDVPTAADTDTALAAVDDPLAAAKSLFGR